MKSVDLQIVSVYGLSPEFSSSVSTTFRRSIPRRGPSSVWF